MNTWHWDFVTWTPYAHIQWMDDMWNDDELMNYTPFIQLIVRLCDGCKYISKATHMKKKKALYRNCFKDSKFIVSKSHCICNLTCIYACTIKYFARPKHRFFFFLHMMCKLQDEISGFFSIMLESSRCLNEWTVWFTRLLTFKYVEQKNWKMYKSKVEKKSDKTLRWLWFCELPYQTYPQYAQ